MHWTNTLDQRTGLMLSIHVMEFNALHQCSPGYKAQTTASAYQQAMDDLPLCSLTSYYYAEVLGQSESGRSISGTWFTLNLRRPYYMRTCPEQLHLKCHWLSFHFSQDFRLYRQTAIYSLHDLSPWQIKRNKQLLLSHSETTHPKSNEPINHSPDQLTSHVDIRRAASPLKHSLPVNVPSRLCACVRTHKP